MDGSNSSASVNHCQKVTLKSFATRYVQTGARFFGSSRFLSVKERLNVIFTHRQEKF